MESHERVSGAVGSRGFTMLELLVVIVILGLLAAVVAPQIMTLFSGAKSDTAALQVETLMTSVTYYKIDTGAYPTAEQGMEALWKAPAGVGRWRGPYVRKPENLLDPWGHPYLYRIPGQQAPVEIYSYGADNKEGGQGEDADVSSRPTR